MVNSNFRKDFQGKGTFPALRGFDQKEHLFSKWSSGGTKIILNGFTGFLLTPDSNDICYIINSQTKKIYP